MLAGGDEQRVVYIDHDEVLDPDQGDKLLGGVNKVSVGLEGVALFGAHDILGFAVGGMFVESGPGAKIVPSEISRDAIKVRLALALGGTRLEHGVVDRDVLALGIELRKSRLEFSCPERLGNVFQERSGLGKVLADGVGERSEEHTSELQSRFDLVCRLLLEKKKSYL